jgi:hypothetical protein
MADAVAGFNPSAGMEFIGLLSYHLRTRFAEVIGRRGTKRRPELDALSLDVPIADDTDTTRADLLPDTAASEAFENAIDRETDRQDVAALLAEMPGILTELQRRALMLTAWDGLTFQAAAERMELTRQMVQQHRDIAARKISRTATARRIWTQRYAYRTQHVTLTGFRRTHTSEVERLILQLEEIEERSGFLP